MPTEPEITEAMVEARKPYNYDSACEMLAEHFLGQPRKQEEVRELAQHVQNAVEDWLGGAPALSAALAQSAPVKAELVAWPNWSGWRSVDTAPEDQHVILATSGGHVGEAIMLLDEDTGRQKWAWALGPLHSNHIPYGWQPLPDPLHAPVASDLRTDGFDGPTGVE